MPAGEHALGWRPAPETPVGSYVMRLTVETAEGRRKVYGDAPSPELARAPVVRVLGVEAALDRRSYTPGETARLTIAADAARCRSNCSPAEPRTGTPTAPTRCAAYRLGEPITIDWRGSRFAPRMVPFPVGELASSVYALRIDTVDGRVGYAPLVVRPKTLGTARQAIVMPTNTWQAYNHYDLDGDGWGERGTRAATRRSGSIGRTETGVPRCAGAATTSASSSGSGGGAAFRTSSPRTISKRFPRATSCDGSTTSSSSQGIRST